MARCASFLVSLAGFVDVALLLLVLLVVVLLHKVEAVFSTFSEVFICHRKKILFSSSF